MIDNACKILEYMCDVIAALKLSAENEDGARFRSSSPTGDGSGKGGFFQGIIFRCSQNVMFLAGPHISPVSRNIGSGVVLVVCGKVLENQNFFRKKI